MLRTSPVRSRGQGLRVARDTAAESVPGSRSGRVAADKIVAFRDVDQHRVRLGSEGAHGAVERFKNRTGRVSGGSADDARTFVRQLSPALQLVQPVRQTDETPPKGQSIRTAG